MPMFAHQSRLTVKLRGRATAPIGAGVAQYSFRAHGDITALHGTLQRLLEVLSDACILSPSEHLPDTLSAQHQPDGNGKLEYIVDSIEGTPIL